MKAVSTTRIHTHTHMMFAGVENIPIQRFHINSSDDRKQQQEATERAMRLAVPCVLDS